MNHHSHRAARWLAALGCLLGTASALAVAPEIRDDGKFFSAEAVIKADERIAEISRKYDRDLLIETFATVPAADLEKVKAMDAKQRGEYFFAWAKDRAHHRAVNGLYILICKEPRFLRISVVEKEPHKLAADTWQVVEKAMVKEFKDAHFDEGLEQAVRIVEERLAKEKK